MSKLRDKELQLAELFDTSADVKFGANVHVPATEEQRLALQGLTVDPYIATMNEAPGRDWNTDLRF